MKLKNILTISSLVVLTSFLTSCSSFIENMHRDLDRQEKSYGSNQATDEDDYFNRNYKPNQKRRTSSVYNKPGRNREVSTSTQKQLNPTVKRQYQDEKVALKRVTASDLTDNGNDGSLWGNADSNSFLLTSSKNKSTGDIVQINVFQRLKSEISQELSRAFPDNPYDKRQGPEGDKAADAKAPAEAAPQTASTDLASDSSHDKISGVVVEEINREHLLIKGRKNIVFKNKKRMVEVQALVSRRDISDDDSINSDSIIESNVTVVR